MARKTVKTKKEEAERSNVDSYEKLRNELFDYRVEIQSFKHSIKMLCACVSVVLALLGFFGYNHIESILDKVESNANSRLATTDALLAKVNTEVLDSLMLEVEKKTASYSTAISALEKGTRVNNELYKKLIDGLPFNNSIENKYDPYILKDVNNLFDIVYYSSDYSAGKKGECYVVMGEKYIKEKEDVLLVSIETKDRNRSLFYQYFEVQSNYNKLYFRFSKFNDDTDYYLRIILLRKNGTETYGYNYSKRITLKE